ncbi:hypothetical protein [Mucilaginibacter sp. L196]|uniref:hypothetical protein n=1 Tax=Mucilaginibacter sp. L196 TaxID=1641870 RepID=UPI00131B7400|nr:hypothetical protein [Mucilaginibacter sp. L196]
MDNIFKNFYRKLYMRTGGFIPSIPHNNNIYPGNFLQIRNGQMTPLGNIFRNGIIESENYNLGYGIKLDPAYWNFSDGVTKPYSGRGSGHGPIGGEFEYSKQVLAFSGYGSFFFRSSDPQSVKVRNWNQLQQQLIIKLTQTLYSFREVYVVTETVSTADWTLAIAGSANAELEIATDTENFGLVDIFGDPTARTIQAKEIEYYYRQLNRKPVFYKAKKLALQDEKIEQMVSEMVAKELNQDEWASEFYDYDFHYDQMDSSQDPGNYNINILDLIKANELNPHTALMYFKWVDTNLDDVEKLFFNYGG